MEKNINISVIRLISLLMIITCHIFQGLDNELAFWFNLGVQIFFFISGYLYGNKEVRDFKKFFKNKIIKILMSLSVLVLIMVIVEYFCFNHSYSKKFILANLLGFGGFYGTLDLLGNTWFVSYILICYLLTPVLQKLIKNNVNATKNLLILIVLSILFMEFDVMYINGIWLCNYIIGYYYGSNIKTKKKKRDFRYIILALITIVLPFSLCLKYDLINGIPNIIRSHRLLICSMEHTLLGCLLFLMFNFVLGKINIKDNYILRFSDKYSYYIYLVHQIFILNDMSLLNLTDYFMINIIIIFIMAILCGVILYWLCFLILKLSKTILVKN